MAITAATLRLMRSLRRDIGTEVDTVHRHLTRAWAAAWSRQQLLWQAAAADLVAEAQRLDHWPRPTDIARLGTVMTALDQAEAALDTLAGLAAGQAIGGAKRIIDLDADREVALIASQAPEAEREGLTRRIAGRTHVAEDAVDVRLAAMSRIRTDAVNVMRTRTEGQITSDLMPLSADATEAMRRELIRGIDVGDNPRDAARRMVAAVEGQFNGGLSRALNVSRTEMLDAYRQTSHTIHNANRDIVPAWEWYAELDDRTCASCWGMHGTMHPVADPGPDDHQQGRCTRLPVLASWEELGITAPEPPHADTLDPQPMFWSLPRASQLQIMGPARLAMLEDGRIGWGDLPTIRNNPNWRRSYAPTTVRDLQRRVDLDLPPTPRPTPLRPAPTPRPRLGTTTLPAPGPTPGQRISAGDFTAMRQAGPQRGSNPGGLFDAPGGSQWYVKVLPEQQARNEALAASLYRAAGINAPEVHLGRGAAGLTTGPGQVQIASRVVPDAVPVRGPAAVQTQLREGFGVDAWVANWDVTGLQWDNLITSGGALWRIDAGGALRFRARGGPKGASFGPTVDEWLTLRDPSRAPTAAQAFGGMSRAELLAAVERVRSVNVATIRRLVREHGLDKGLADLLVARRKHLIDRLPALRAEVRRQAAYERARARAVSGQDALNRVKHQLPLGSQPISPTPAGWSAAQLEASTLAAQSYRGSGYRSMNEQLRQAAGSPVDSARIRHLDHALGAGPLDRNVLGYRGIQNPDRYIPGWNHVDVVGLTWTDFGYSSISADLRVAHNFAGVGAGSVVMRVVTPRGVGALRLSNMASPGHQPYGIEFEAEVLLSRGLTFRVVADHGMVDGRRILDVEVV